MEAVPARSGDEELPTCLEPLLADRARELRLRLASPRASTARTCICLRSSLVSLCARYISPSSLSSPPSSPSYWWYRPLLPELQLCMPSLNPLSLLREAVQQ